MSPTDELLDLAERYYDRLLTPTELQRLNGLLQSNPDAQRAFLEVGTIHADLQWMSAASFDATWITSLPTKPSQPLVVTAGSSPIRRALRPMLIAAAAIFVAWLSVISLRINDRTAAPPAIAQILRMVDAVWSSGTSLAQGASLTPGKLQLRRGLVEIQSNSGATILLEGPAELDLLHASEAALYSGRAVIRISDPDSAFKLVTATAQLVDLGTEFGVEIEAGDKTVLQVYEGEVLARVNGADDSKSAQRVESGQAVRLGTESHAIAFSPTRFVRTLPNADDPTGRGKFAYNRSRFTDIQIVPAPLEVMIDGSLDDWDLSGQLTTTCEPPYDEYHYLRAAMMYDSQYLYVGAVVGDPYPMQSQVSPQQKSKNNLYGGGGGVALRISTDRRAGWPLDAASAIGRENSPARPIDTSDKLCFVMLWYSRPEDKACIHLRYGMDMHESRVNPPGYEGAFRKGTDRRSYTLEYRIPWSLLHAEDDPPRAGDQLAAMWLVHWSDAHGKAWKGQLIDVMQAQEPGWNFDRAATWGRAVYHVSGRLPVGTVVPRD
jgi:hypothetical protein